MSLMQNSSMRLAVLATLLGGAVVGVAVAQQPLPDGSTSPGGLVTDSQLSDGFAVMVDSTGKVRHMRVKPGQHKMLMKMATPMKTGTVIYRTAGHYYMSTDPKISEPAFYESDLPE